jgi:steroid delta-isomerase-like uncharacterized protein
MSDNVPQTIGNLVEAINACDVERVASFYAPLCEGIDIAEATPLRGPEAMRSSFECYLRAFPDLRVITEEVLVQGERAVVVWTAHGTHLGPLRNIPATGRTVEVRGVAVLTVRENQVQKL